MVLQLQFKSIPVSICRIWPSQGRLLAAAGFIHPDALRLALLDECSHKVVELR